MSSTTEYPDTFFGEVTSTTRTAKTVVDKCDFLFETYQHSPREKLLEFMAGAYDIEHLQTLGQRDLAIIYCERIAQKMQIDEVARAAARQNDVKQP